MSLRDQILAATTQLKPRAVQVPELGGTVYVRPLSLGGVGRFRALVEKDQARAPIALLVEGLCDETGKRLFTMEDEAVLSDLPGAAANRLLEEINEISGLGAKAAESASGN